MTNVQFSKIRWLLTTVGFFLYLGDIFTDIAMAVKYFSEEQYVWGGLTVLFVSTGLLVTQTFSCAWYLDDMNGQETTAGMSKCRIVALHILGTGTIVRYYHLLKQGFKKVWTKTNPVITEEMNEEQHKMHCMMADLSMLKLFEAFLESVPQLLLQLFILLDDYECSVIRYVSLVISFFNVAWALVDYHRCLRRSVPAYNDMESGLPTAVYFLYKLCTITSHILSCSFFLMLSPYTTVALTFYWVLGTIWANWLQTSFCSSPVLELFYRGVVGVILVFTFFNVKGKNTKVEIIIYYAFYSAINVTAPILLFFLRPELLMNKVLLTTGILIIEVLVLGLLFLVVYYLYLHPSGELVQPDEVDGMEKVEKTTRELRKLRTFLQP